MVAMIALSGCGPAPIVRRQMEAQKQSYRRLKFDSAANVVAVMHRTPDENAPTVLTGVVEIGGPVESLRGDTLIMEPHYIVMVRSSDSGEVQIVRLSNKKVLPDLVFIPIGPGFRIEDPNADKSARPSVASMLWLVTMALYLKFGSW